MSQASWDILAKAVPNLVIFIVLVLAFLRAQSKMMKEFMAYMRERDEQVDEVIDVNTEVIRDNTQIIRENSASLALALAAVDRNTLSIDKNTLSHG